MLNAICKQFIFINSFHFSQRRSGRKKIKRENSRLYREIERLKSLLKKQATATQKYQKHLQRLLQMTESLRSKTQKMIGRRRVPAEIHRTLLFHNALISNIRQKYQETKERRESASDDFKNCDRKGH